jgi:hypothetical protein
MEEVVARTLVMVSALVACSAPAPRSAPGNPAPVTSASPSPRSSVSTSLELVPDGPGWAVAFRLKNTSATELTGQVFEPFVLFTLEVTSLRGERLSLARPAFDTPGRPRSLVLAPGAEVRLVTPFHLRFDPAVPPSGGGDRTVWSIRSPRIPVIARASFEIPGLGLQAAQARID